MYLTNAGITGGTVTVTPTTVDENTEQVTVTVRVSHGRECLDDSVSIHG